MSSDPPSDPPSDPSRPNTSSSSFPSSSRCPHRRPHLLPFSPSPLLLLVFESASEPSRTARSRASVTFHFFAPDSFCMNTTVVSAADGVTRWTLAWLPPATNPCVSRRAVHAAAYALAASRRQHAASGQCGTITANDNASSLRERSVSRCATSLVIVAGSNGGFASNDPATGRNLKQSPSEPKGASTSAYALKCLRK